VPDPAQPDRGFVDITANVDATDITGVAGDIQTSLNNEFGFDADGIPVVTVEFPDGVLRMRAKGIGLELRADESDDIVPDPWGPVTLASSANGSPECL